MKLYDYNSIASEYDAKWKGYLQSTHQKALELLDLKPDDKILDVSAGTGLLSNKIIKVCDVVLVDSSEAMLTQAKQKNSFFKIVLSDVHKLPFRDEEFTKAVCVSALHHYSKPKKALSEIYRVIKDKLVLIDWCNDPLYFKLFDLTHRLTNKHYIKAYTTKEIIDLLNEIGFKTTIQKWHYKLWPLFAVVAVK